MLELELAGAGAAGVDEPALRRTVTAVLSELGLSEGDVAVGVSFVPEDEMRRLNADHRGRDAVTDVLSFPIDELEELPDGVERQLGDVVVCLPQVARQAAEEGVAPAVELTTMVVHGLLHLAGHDHEADEGEMLARQDALLSGLEPIPWRP